MTEPTTPKVVRVVPPGSKLKAIGDYVYLISPESMPVRIHRDADPHDPNAWETFDVVKEPEIGRIMEGDKE